MDNINETVKAILIRCKNSPEFFIETFCKVEHPKAGVLNFKLFEYQKNSLTAYRGHRHCLYKKTRQCFAGESSVWGPQGPKRIDEIKIGDNVYSYDNGKLVSSIVNDVYNNGLADCIEVRTKSGHKAITTPEHLYLTKRGWIEAGKLLKEDVIIEFDKELNVTKGQIKSVIKSVNTRVYDLDVPPHHNYIVDGAVVHNCGISTLTGAYALWYAMFHSHSKVLIVSKRDDDAKEFLHKNVKFVFDNLPGWFKDLYWHDGLVNNEHKIEFANGARITSLSSSKETLRSNSASLVIIDEAAFMPHMDEMWSSGWSTLMQGGSSIVITTVNGVGNWYWGKWMDAISGQSEFYPIEVNWWDMDWEIKFYDSISNKEVCIAPTKGKIENKRLEDIEKYGKYWSPWLEEQYRGLQVRGETNKFRQEVLAEFVGSGNTILEGPILRWLGQQLEETMKTTPHNVVDQPIEFTNNKGEFFLLDFVKSFWIWKTPVKDHRYVMGFDISGGESKDFTAIEVFDLTTREQVAEINLKVMPRFSEQMAAYVGSWYNHALMAIDTNGMGELVGQNMEMDGYPNLWRHKKKTTDKGSVGLRISNTQKQTLNKLLRDNIGMDGFTIYSPRLYRQLTTYINLGNGRSGNESGIGNRDDLVIATGLVFMAALDNLSSNAEGLMPMMTNSYSTPSMSTGASLEVPADHRFLMPLSTSGIAPQEGDLKLNAGGELKKFVSQICGIPRNPGENEIDYKKRVQAHLSSLIPNTRNKKDAYKNTKKLNLKYTQQDSNIKPKSIKGSFRSVIKKKDI